jgi:hypothetical protein
VRLYVAALEETCSARPPGSTLRVRKLTATNVEEILPEFDSKSTAAVPRDVPIDLEQISLDDGCGFLPSPCLYGFPPSTIEELTTVLLRTSDYTDDDEACSAPIPQHLKWCYFTVVHNAFHTLDGCPTFTPDCFAIRGLGGADYRPAPPPSLRPVVMMKDLMLWKSGALQDMSCRSSRPSTVRTSATDAKIHSLATDAGHAQEGHRYA